MGSSIAMIDYHYGHLARDSREHAVSLLDALALERAVDARWTLRNSWPRDRSAPAIPALAGIDPGESWTLRGRRARNLSRLQSYVDATCNRPVPPFGYFLAFFACRFSFSVF
jgi:hypothetical protein